MQVPSLVGSCCLEAGSGNEGQGPSEYIYILGVLGAGLLTWQQPVRGAWVCRGLRLYGYLWQQLLLVMPLFQIHLEKGWGGPKASPRAKENERGKAGADELDLLLLH